LYVQNIVDQDDIAAKLSTLAFLAALLEKVQECDATEVKLKYYSWNHIKGNSSAQLMNKD